MRVNRSILGYQIGQYKLDLITKTLSIKSTNTNMTISERGFLFLCELAKASPEFVTKEYLHKVLWPDRHVSDWALARIVSDTRLLLADNGGQQELIKTARGIGYSLCHCTPLYENPERTVKIQTSTSFSFKKILMGVGGISFFIVAAISIYGAYSQFRLITAVDNIEKYQTYSFKAFQAQSKRRDELVKQLEKRLNVKRDRQFEKFFVHYYPQMNEDEKFVFSQIRGITESGLYLNNLAVFETLEKNREIYTIIPKTKALANHLQFWLNKYRSVFLKRQDMSLLYVGVEDGVPYPSNVDQQIKNWLKKYK